MSKPKPIGKPLLQLHEERRNDFLGKGKAPSCLLTLSANLHNAYRLVSLKIHGHPLFKDSLLSTEDITNPRLHFQFHLLQQRTL